MKRVLLAIAVVWAVAFGAYGAEKLATRKGESPDEAYLRGFVAGVVQTWEDLGPAYGDGCVGGPEFSFYRELLDRKDRSISAVQRSFRTAIGRCTE